MGPSVCDRPPPRSALIEPRTGLGELLHDLAARMSPQQRGAFLTKMAAMDRRQELSPAAVTLGCA